ncbi:MAG TPA: hypothetical protein PLL10_05650 [Elusimicrobiales bacterium]|nr:hypothetical protein [Elusimicrobiales bacterium]
MPEPRLHETVIADRIIELINLNLSVALGLKVVSFGDLDFYPALETLTDNTPTVFVKPAPTTTLERITTGQTYKIAYNFRIVFVKTFSRSEDATRLMTIETDKLAELFIDNVNLGDFVITNGQVLRTNLTTIEWKPPEDLTVAGLNANMTATALVFTVETTSRK